MWTDPTQHVYAVGEVVTAATLNTYVQANLASISAYSTATHYYESTVGGGTATTETVFDTHLGIATFPETFTMVVTVLGRIGLANGTASTFSFYIQDETGARILLATQPWLVGLAAGGYSALSVYGFKHYNPNVSAGFKVAYSLGTAPATVTINADTSVGFYRGWI